MVLRHVSNLKDHPQGLCLYLAKVTELFKIFEEFFFFKFRVQRMAPQGSQHTPATVLLPQRRI